MMLSYRLTCLAFLAASAAAASGQDTSPAASSAALPASAASTPAQTIALTVAKSTPMQVALDREVRVKKVGQPIHGRLVQPVYAFDHLVVPSGAEVNGRISRIADISGKRRVLGILNADFTPAREVDLEFTDLLLPDGKKIPFQAAVAPGSGQVMQLVSSKEDKRKKGVKDATSEKIDQAKQEARRQWREAMKQVKEPGKVHRLERYAMNQLPARPQYLASGTLYYAELKEPLDFGSEPLTTQMVSSIGSPPPQGSLIRALLVTPLDSATSEKGSEVEAVLSQPLFDGDRLIFPEGSRLKGSVVQVKAARRLHHNGQLRIAFRQIIPPEELQKNNAAAAQGVTAGLEGVQAGKDGNVKLDSEGGAEATTPKTRYLSTAISLTLASASFRQHEDADDIGKSQSGNGVAGGLGGFKLVGLALGAAVKSQPFGMAMGAYGASRSVYSHFIAKGQDVVFPRNTTMEISIGAQGKNVLPPPPEAKNSGGNSKTN